MANRKAISKKVRFEIFKRDSFTCQYCGAKPPEVVLEIDHVIPVSKGGTNEEENLVTSCFDCNRGKSNILLSVGSNSLEEKIRIQKEKQEQMKAFEKMISQKKALLTRRANSLESTFLERTGYSFSDSFMTSVKDFFKRLPREDVFDAMDIALSKISDPEKALKYFCGICWRKIRERDYG